MKTLVFIITTLVSIALYAGDGNFPATATNKEEAKAMAKEFKDKIKSY